MSSKPKCCKNLFLFLTMRSALIALALFVLIWVHFQAFLLIMVNLDWSRLILSDLGRYRVILVPFGWSWLIIVQFGQSWWSWFILVDLDGSWLILVDLGLTWVILVDIFIVVDLGWYWVDMSKWEGMDRIFLGLAGLLRGAALQAWGKLCPSRLVYSYWHSIWNRFLYSDI